MALIQCPDCGSSVSSNADSCPKCGWKVDLQQAKPRRRGTGILVCLTLLAGLVAYQLTYGRMEQRQEESQRAWNARVEKEARRPQTVTYQVIGVLNDKCSVTYSNGQGGTEQADVTFSNPLSNSTTVGEWTKEFTSEAGKFVSLSAQNTGNSSKIVVSILVDGEEARSSDATGQGAIGSCDYTIPNRLSN